MFENDTYKRPEVHWPGKGRPNATYQVVFRELESAFHSTGEMRLAESMLDDLLNRLADSLHHRNVPDK